MANYFDHIADIGIIGTGNSIENAFIDAAVATFAIMANLQKIKPDVKITIEFEESDPELALVTWLNLLLAKARCHDAIFSKFKLIKLNDHWKGAAYGEHWRNDIERGTEVKGATLTALSVKQDNNHWSASCVVDV